ncbi:MAG: hypothetical protein CR991_10315 [Proteobacteria bacterium]|nr:MAG: hypothetical protein CR991_10315 [Pseudomonadota bacterium]
MKKYFSELNRLPQLGERVFIPPKPKNYISPKHPHGGCFGVVVGVEGFATNSIDKKSSSLEVAEFLGVWIRIHLDNGEEVGTILDFLQSVITSPQAEEM